MENAVILIIGLIVGYIFLKELIHLIFLPFQLLIRGTLGFLISKWGILLIVLLLLSANNNVSNFKSVDNLDNLGPKFNETKEVLIKQFDNTKETVEELFSEAKVFYNMVEDNKEKLDEVEKMKKDLENSEELNKMKDKL